MEALSGNKTEQMNDANPKGDILPRIDHLTSIIEIHTLKLTGVQEACYENGQMAYRRYYKDGKEDGKHYQWYPNGQLKSTINWVAGDFEGLQEDWDKEGRLIERKYFKGSEIQWQERLDTTSKRVKRATFKKGFLWFTNQIDHFTDLTAQESKKKITLTPKKKGGIKI